MHKDNERLREALKQHNVKQWELAQRLGMSENTLIRRLRTPLDARTLSKYLDAVTKRN